MASTAVSVHPPYMWFQGWYACLAAGYLAAAFGVLSGEGSTVIGIDKHKRLVRQGSMGCMYMDACYFLLPCTLGIDVYKGHVLDNLRTGPY